MTAHTIPQKIKSIWDNRGKTIDRYTIVFEDRERGFNICLGLSVDPDYPLGFSQFGTCIEGSHLGIRITWEDLPSTIKKHIIERGLR